ncbi:F-actin-monooxygenase mical1 [Triplophysa dalaica]|uniref:F-actin-monooxygenase mical1 n=1 Tax=Triplophysa dalaica TaxID=1582913 RepID=UPI0024E027B2|nr:F-actin-monooxygenase mical1 [Triplophysa dalaica]XP_056589125.1 F-actin-monooxygenase mical1 [Triplophysa dalaica]XP_056589126.1 F-actin-monooxygenase mical1 [Triplophysa dalaica]
MANQSDPVNPSHALFDKFGQAQTCKEALQNFSELCRHLELDPKDYKHFYSKLKDRLNYWKAKELWQKIDKRAAHPDYGQGNVCRQNKCLVLGAGPCGLRTAIELALLGAQVVVLEKRGSFARNNVLHLWPYTIRDLRNLGAKKFYGRFCTGTLDHISIRQLQLILLKMALLLGVEVHTGVSFQGLIEPSGTMGWRADLSPKSHPASEFQFDVFISAGGGRYVPDGFKIKELRGKLAIGITANFINHHSKEEAQVPEISGVARIYNQKFFQELQAETGIDLENIVYYKDETHYFVMTAKKASLLKKGVIKQDYSDANQLLAPSNVNQKALLLYAYDAADFSTEHMLPDPEFATNYAGQPDVAMFDFTSMHRAENASLVKERKGKRLLIGLVGDCLVEPFWPLGTGIARGFLASFDAAWMVRNWGKGLPPLQVLAERESVYQLLSQTTPENTSKNYQAYSIDPSTRYPNLKLSIKPKQVQHLYNLEEHQDVKKPILKPKPKKESIRRLEELLSWCQRNTGGYDCVRVKDLSESWRSGLALCALIHHFRPELLEMSSLGEFDATKNNQLAFDLLEKEYGITPVMRASDMSSCGKIDQLSMVVYLTQIRNALTEKDPSNSLSRHNKSLSLARTRSAVFFINKLKHNSLQRRKERLTSKRGSGTEKMKEKEEGSEVKAENPVTPVLSPDMSGSELCYFCQEHLYVLERGSAEGKFFHRGCFKCYLCSSTLRQGGYTFHSNTGRFYCELHSQAEDEEDEEARRASQANAEHGIKEKENEETTTSDERTESPLPHISIRRKGSYKISVDPDFEESTECSAHTDQDDQPSSNPDISHNPPESPPESKDIEGSEAVPVPAPRSSRNPLYPPLPKPRTVHNIVPQDLENQQTEETPSSGDKNGHHDLTLDFKPKQLLRRLQLSQDEKSGLLNLSFSQDSDSETPASSSAASTSSSSKQHEGGEEEGYWSGGTVAGKNLREQRNRKCVRRKSEPPVPARSQHGKIRSKFSPWNLSSPRLQQRFSVLRVGPTGQTQLDHYVSEDDVGVVDDDEEEDDEDLQAEDHFLDCKGADFEISEAEKRDLMKMRTLERKARMSEMHRFQQAQTIQRRLEEIEVTFKDLEEKGVELERALRVEAGSGDSETIENWMELVQDKNTLLSEESDLMVASRQMELEDKQSMLEMELRRYMEMDDSEKSPELQAHEEKILQEMLDVVDMRNSLVSFLEEKRLKELDEEPLGNSIVESKRHSTAGTQVHWA